MFCSKCGKEIPDGSVFCSLCGNQITVSSNEISTNTEPVWASVSIQVSPELENEIIEEYESFGWELKSSQTIDRKDSHLESKFDALYSVTESVNYIKLVFKRNKKMVNYEKIKKLENAYQNTYIRQYPKGPSIAWIVCAILFLPVLTIPFLIIYFVKKSKYQKKCEEIREINHKASLIKNEALNILS